MVPVPSRLVDGLVWSDSWCGRWGISSWPFVGAGCRFGLRVGVGDRRRELVVVRRGRAADADRACELVAVEDRMAPGVEGDPTGEDLDETLREQGSVLPLLHQVGGRLAERGGEVLGRNDDFFRRSILAINSTIGKTNNYLNPRRGWILQPLLETAGAVLGSDVEYVKGSVQLIGYVPTTRRSELIGRVFIGNVVPFGLSTDGLDGTLGAEDSLKFENRFDDVLYYSGGSTDVRGWPDQLLGTKIAREIFDKDGNSLSPQRFAFEPIGGKSKLEASISYRFPFPGLGSKWKLATFLDAGQVSSRQTSIGGKTVVEDDGSLAFDKFKFGAGTGLRYETLFGFVRIDVAMKLNPDDADLISAENLLNGVDEKSRLRRFRLHLSIGQTF